MSSRPEPQEPDDRVATGAGSHFPTWDGSDGSMGLEAGLEVAAIGRASP